MQFPNTTVLKSVLLIGGMLIPFQSSAFEGFLTTGHREAMMANGGSTNICSPGQFAYNPAGLACSGDSTFAESFGSTNFNMYRLNFQQGDLQDLQSSQIQTRPGVSLFSQSFHQNNVTYGMWGIISQLSAEKSLAIHTEANIPYVGRFVQTNSDWLLGGFVAQSLEHFSWGATLGFHQSTYRNIGDFKAAISPTNYIIQQQDILSVEKSVALQMGLITQSAPWKHALIIKPPSYSLSGDLSQEKNEISTSGEFEESRKDGTVRTFEPWQVVLGSEYEISPHNLLGVDATWKSANSTDYDQIQKTDERAPVVALNLHCKFAFTPKTDFLSGAQWTQTVNELTSQNRENGLMISLGVVRLFKGVELGTGLAWSQLISRRYDLASSEWQPNGKLEKIDFTFSSSFSY